ncbi:hypothetical protein ACJJTC_016690 [Scirpophaga incertulas]
MPKQEKDKTTVQTEKSLQPKLHVSSKDAVTKKIEVLIQQGQVLEAFSETVNAFTSVKILHLNGHTALQLAIQDKELFDKCSKIAEIAASKGYLGPMNLLWMECFIRRKRKGSQRYLESMAGASTQFDDGLTLDNISKTCVENLRSTMKEAGRELNIQ